MYYGRSSASWLLYNHDSHKILPNCSVFSKLCAKFAVLNHLITREQSRIVRLKCSFMLGNSFSRCGTYSIIFFPVEICDIRIFGEIIYSASVDGIVKTWDSWTGNCIDVLSTSHLSPVTTIALFPSSGM